MSFPAIYLMLLTSVCITISMGNAGLHFCGAEVMDSDEVIAQAVELAKEADAVIAVVGLNADWETEGSDRTTLALPGRTDELVSKVAAANPKTIVVTQSVCELSPVELDDDLNCALF